MDYELEFLDPALKEWDKLGHTIREQLFKKLEERQKTPRVPKDALHGLPNHYKIKLKSAGYRLVYRVEEKPADQADDDGTPGTLVVTSVGKRNKNLVYNTALSRT